MRLSWIGVLLASTAAAAQLAIINGRVWTANPQQPWAEAVLVDGSRILRAGATADIVRWKAKDAEILDARGRLVAPGFNDAHIHFLSGSLGLANIDLTGICTLETIQRAVADYARANPNRKWITGRGWEYYCFPEKLPRKEWLDAVVKDRPVFLAAYDGHTGWANSKALELADINKTTRFQGFGEIVKDPKTGQPTGCLKEGAQGLVRRHVPVPGRDEKIAALRQGMKIAASLGITSMQNASGDEEELSIFEELARNEELTVRMRLAMSVPVSATPLSRAAEIAALRRRLQSRLVRTGSVKLVIDGVVESYTAAMLAPYGDRPDTVGEPAWPEDKFFAMVTALDRASLQIYTHAIGDRGVRMTLDAYEYALRRNGKRDHRHRIEHIETIHPDDIPRFAKIGVMASMEPIHADPATVGVWSTAAGDFRLPLAFPWRSLEKAGARLVFSSDWPASISVNPIRGIHNAVNRRTTDGKPPGGWIPEQRVTIDTAMRGYTSYAAYASFEELYKGSLKPGMASDIVILSHNVFEMDPARLHETKVDCTVFNGKVIHRRAGAF